MKATFRDTQLWREILSAHAQRQTTPPRLVVDESFLTRWEEGSLSEQEHQQLLDELASSHESRKIVRLLVDSGALTLPASDREDMPQVLKESEPATVMAAEEETRVSELPGPPVFASRMHEAAAQGSQAPSSRRKSFAWLPVGGLIAAGLAVAVTLTLMNTGGNRPLDSALSALEDNNLQEAFDQADQAIEVATSDEQREQAFEIMTESGEQLAAVALTEGRFDDVRLISDRVSDRANAVETVDAATQEILGRLESLRLQARRGIDSAIGLTEMDSLTDYSASIPDLMPEWLTPSEDQRLTQPEIDAIQEEYEQAIEQYPSSRDLRLNFGQFLLEQQQTQAAIEQFRAIVEGNEVVGLIADPDNREALVGMAIAVLNDPSSESASEAMQKLMEMIPEDQLDEVLEAIQGNLPSRIRESLPEGVVPSADPLDMLRESLENLREEGEAAPPQDATSDVIEADEVNS